MVEDGIVREREIITAEDRTAFEKLPVPFCLFYIYRGTCRLLVVSDGFCEANKAKREFINNSGEDLLGHIHPDDYKRFYTDVEEACMDPEGRYEATYRVKAAPGDEYKWLSGRGNVKRCDDGAFLLYVFFADVNDKTELLIAREKENNRNEILLSQIMANTQTAIFWKDADRRFRGVNQAFLDYYGFKGEDVVIGKNDEEMGWHTDPDIYKNDEIQILSEGISTDRVRGKCIARGENRDIVASKSPIIVDGKILGLVGSFEDVTREVRLENEIIELNEELSRQLREHHLLMDSTGVCIIKIDLHDYTIAEYNDAMCSMIGFTREEYELRFRHDMNAFFTGKFKEALDELKNTVEETLKAGKKRFLIDMQIPTSRGARWIGGTATFSEPDSDVGRPRYLYAVYRDTSDIIEAQKKRELAEVEIEKAALIQSSLDKMRQMIDSVPAGLGAVRLVNGVIDDTIQINRYFFDWINVSANENKIMETSEFLECVYAEDRERIRNDFKLFFAGKRRGACEYRFHMRGDGYIWVRVRGSLVRNSPSDVVAYFIFSNINDQKLAEARLISSQENYKRTVDALNIGMWTYYIQERRIVMGDNAATRAMCEKNGWPGEFEDAPESTLPFIDEDDREKYMDMFREINAGHDASCEVWYKHIHGVEPQCERESYHVVSDGDGIPVKAYGIGMNVTAVRKVEERHEREIEYLHNNSDESLVAKGHYDLTNNIVLEYDSRISGKRVYDFEAGITYDEAYEGLVKRACSEEDRLEIAEKLNRENLIRRYRQGEMQTTLQYHRMVEGQDPIWISMTIHIYMEPVSGNLELFSYAYDITERMITETIMNVVSQKKFDYIGIMDLQSQKLELFAKSHDVEMVNVRGKIEYEKCREYVRKHYQISEDDQYIYDNTDLNKIEKNLNEKGYHTMTYRRKNGDRIECKQIDYLWLNSAIRLAIIIRTDVTVAFEREQKQLLRIENAKLGAERANEAKSTFLSSMSHDLRTPLNGVLGFTQAALNAADDAKKQYYLEKIQASGKLLLDLVNDTLELSRVESGKAELNMEVVPAAEIVPAIVSALTPEATAKGVRVISELTQLEGKLFWCDKLKMQKIALNLISNSIKYTPEDGTVKISMVPGPSDFPECQWSLCVEDTGIGMSKEFMQKMYEPFAQEKRSETVKTPGTGLGLAIVKRYVDILGGRLDVESELHRGTKWIISIPIDELPDGTEQKADEIPYSQSFSGRHALLCEDNEMNVEIAVMMLREKGFTVEIAENGKLGVEKFSGSELNHFDLILMDIRMPVMNGYEATRTIRKLDRPDAADIPVIAMTADAFSESVREAKDAGMNGYIIKPLNPDAMFRTIAENLL